MGYTYIWYTYIEICQMAFGFAFTSVLYKYVAPFCKPKREEIFFFFLLLLSIRILMPGQLSKWKFGVFILIPKN